MCRVCLLSMSGVLGRSGWVERLEKVRERSVGWEIGRECPGHSLKVICGIGRGSQFRSWHCGWAPG